MAAPNLPEIESGIYELEHEESSPYKYILLAALHACRKEMLGVDAPAAQIAAYSTAAPAEPLARYGDSDFLRAVSRTDPAAAWAVMDELMETLLAVRPRVYDSVMRKLESL